LARPFLSQGGKLVDDSGKPIFGEGDNRAKMLKALNFYKDLVDSGAAPKRSSRSRTTTTFNAAAQAGTRRCSRDGHLQYFQMKEIMPRISLQVGSFGAAGPTADHGRRETA